MIAGRSKWNRNSYFRVETHQFLHSQKAFAFLRFGSLPIANFLFVRKAKSFPQVYRLARLRDLKILASFEDTIISHVRKS